MNPDLPSSVAMLMLGVSDLAASVAFYRDTLGLTFANNAGEFAFFSAGAITLILSAPLGKSRDNKAGAMEVIFPVGSVAATHAALVERGCHFLSAPHEVMPCYWAANFTDPDGHILSVVGPQ